MNKFVKIFVSLLVTGTMLMSGSALAMVTVDTSDFAVYVNNNLAISGNAKIQGNAVVKNSFNEQGSASVNGALLSLEENDEINPRYTGSNPNYPINFKAFPELEKRNDLITNWQGGTIDHSGWYDKLIVNSGGPLTINTNGNLIEIRADELTISDAVTINGGGKVVFYVDKFECKGNPKLNATGDTGKVLVYLSGNHDCTIANNTTGTFHLYSAGSKSIFIEQGNINGNIYTSGNINIMGSSQVNGYVYLPESDIQIAGSAVINGKLVANNVEMQNSAQVINGDVTGLTDGIVADITQKQTFHVTTSASEGGTITAYDADMEEGTVITIVATPAEGYRFVRFDGDQPDSNGNITVTKNISIQAVFEKSSVVIPDGYANGLLGEYFDSFETLNDTAIRVKRIDPQVAFNFGYEAPQGTNGQIEPDTFAERWTGYIKAPVTGDYTFKTYSDDGVKLSINGQSLIDRWGYVSLDYTISAPIHLEAGQLYPITLEHQQMPLYSAIFLFWEAEGVPMGLVPESAFYVDQNTHDMYSTPVFVNELSREGTGINKQFFDGVEGLQSGDLPDCVELGGIVDYAWQQGSPDDEVLGDSFSARMTGYMEGKFTEEVTLEFIVDDGIRVWVDDKQIIDSWEPHSDAVVEGTFDMVAGKMHKLVIEYNDLGGGATCIMRWKSPSQELQVVPIQYLYSE
jgi:cytoskeletal protein CcmA (bactofilin family)